MHTKQKVCEMEADGSQQQQQQLQQLQQQLQVADIKANAASFNFLSETYDVMKCFENNPSKLGNKINELRGKFDKARSILAATPGLDMSEAEQKAYYETLLKQYYDEHSLLTSYKDMCKFDMSKLQETDVDSSASNDQQTAAMLTNVARDLNDISAEK